MSGCAVEIFPNCSTDFIVGGADWPHGVRVCSSLLYYSIVWYKQHWHDDVVEDIDKRTMTCFLAALKQLSATDYATIPMQ